MQSPRPYANVRNADSLGPVAVWNGGGIRGNARSHLELGIVQGVDARPEDSPGESSEFRFLA